MARKYKKLTYQDRLYLQSEHEKGVPVTKIADELKVHRQTIYREIARGTLRGKYDAEYAQKQIFR